jgi:hypothetical protein
MVVRCPSCRSQLDLTRLPPGSKIQCPGCNKTFGLKGSSAQPRSVAAQPTSGNSARTTLTPIESDALSESAGRAVYSLLEDGAPLPRTGPRPVYPQDQQQRLAPSSGAFSQSENTLDHASAEGLPDPLERTARIARAQKAVILCVLADILLYVGSYTCAGPPASKDVLLVAFLIIKLARMVCVYRLASALGRSLPLAYAMFMLVPCVLSASVHESS